MYIQLNYSTQCVQCQQKMLIGKKKMLKIGSKLRELRRAEKLTQQQLADKLNLGRVNYTRYETDAVRPDYETLIALADFYNVSLDEIFGRDKY